MKNRKTLLASAVSGLMLSGLVAGSAAAAAVVEPPSDPIARAAFDMLNKHCARCHEASVMKPDQKPKKNFGNVLKLEELAKTPALIVPGNPDASQIFNQVARKEMPYDLYAEFAPVAEVTEADVKALRDWIEDLGKKQLASCETRKFVSPKDMVAAMAADLDKQQPNLVKGTRYITLTHLYNACTDDQQFEAYRQAVVKTLNSLSRSSEVVRLETVDPERTIIRFNLADVGWDEADWNLLLASYTYGVKPDTKAFGLLETVTGTPLAYVRGDWLAFTATQPPLYNKLLKLPDTFQELEKQVGLDVADNIKKFVAKRAGFAKSGVSQHNRMIERHPIKTGYFWTSYDFAGSKDIQNLFSHPLGPGGDKGFVHDGGETIFSLANGFQAYYLSTAAGKSLDKGPTSIVQDDSQKDRSVTNGISCMGCHDQGMRKMGTGDVRTQVLKDRSFSRAEIQSIEALYLPLDVMAKQIEDDAERFRTAMKRAGLDPALKPNNIEMISALAKRYEDNLDPRLAAAELGMSLTEFTKAVDEGVTLESKAVARRLVQGLVPRDQFENEFTKLVAAIPQDELVAVKALVEEPKAAEGAAAAAAAAPASAGASASAAAAPAAAGVAAASSASAPAAAPVEVAKASSAPKEVSGTFDLALTSDKSAYQQNERAVFSVITAEDCSLTLTSVDNAGRGTILFPNAFQQDNRIKAKQEFRFGGAASPFRFLLPDKGTETVVAECTIGNSSTIGVKPDFKAGGFTDVGDFAKRLTRQIATDSAQAKAAGARQIKVEAGQALAKSEAGKSAGGSKSDIVGRTAIKLEVK
jgi:uncharacterized protein DUF4384